MDADLIAAGILFGPAAVALPALAVAWHRGNHHREAERALLTLMHTARAAGTVPPTPPAREPLPAGARPADVIDIAAHRRTA